MNKFVKIALATTLVAGFAAPAFAQSNSATANSSVSIIIPISITKSTDLLFGTVAKPLTGSGTVAVNASTGTRTVGGGVVGMTSTTGRATFTVTGDTTRAFTATVPANFTLGNGTPGDNITVALTSDVPAALTAGSATIGVGGSFSLAAAQTVGAYTGSFAVSVAYN
ncbi:MAG: DUF4402 domain-containing protein [Sphingosinicella sp.]|nr:DUF4402 domain-containing protein [Sphingosinicella sp.]